MALGPAVLERDVSSLDETGFAQSLAGRAAAQVAKVWRGREATEVADYRHRLLLRTKRERQRTCRPTEKSDEISSLHSMTSSARTSSAVERFYIW